MFIELSITNTITLLSRKQFPKVMTQKKHTDHYEIPANANQHNLPYQKKNRIYIPLNTLRPIQYTSALTNTTSAVYDGITSL